MVLTWWGGGCLYVFVGVSPTWFLGWCQASPTHWKHWWSPRLRVKTKTEFSLYLHGSYLVRWWMFVCVCVCFSYLVYWLVQSKPHKLEGLTAPKFACKNSAPPNSPLNVDGVWVLLCVYGTVLYVYGTVFYVYPTLPLCIFDPPFFWRPEPPFWLLHRAGGLCIAPTTAGVFLKNNRDDWSSPNMECARLKFH